MSVENNSSFENAAEKHDAVGELSPNLLHPSPLSIYQKSSENDDHTGLIPFLWKNITSIGTIGYLFISLIGIIYSSLVFNKFKVNYIDFADVSDFFLGAFKRPLGVMIWIGISVAIFLIPYCIGKLVHLGTRYFAFAFLASLVAATFPAVGYAEYTVANIKEQRASIYELRLTRERAGDSNPGSAKAETIQA